MMWVLGRCHRNSFLFLLASRLQCSGAGRGGDKDFKRGGDIKKGEGSNIKGGVQTPVDSCAFYLTIGTKGFCEDQPEIYFSRSGYNDNSIQN